MAEDKNTNSNDKQSSWSLLKQVYKLKRQQAKQNRQVKEKELLARRAKKKSDKQQKKVQIKELKKELKVIKANYKKELHNLKYNHNDTKQERRQLVNNLHQEYNKRRIVIYDKIRKIRFDFGDQYNTIVWRLTKWAYGIRKEFFRIIWSSPKNTFKYLGIIVVIVLFLSLIFLLIDYLVVLI